MISIQEYKKINTSYKRKLLYKWGAEAGFYSEFNNLALAVLYCLENKIQFVLYTPKKAVLKYNLGWCDYFIEFCEQIVIKNFFFDKILSVSSQRQSIDVKPWKMFVGKICKKILRIDFYGYEFWNDYRSTKFVNSQHTISEINFINDFYIAYKGIILMLYAFPPLVQEKINFIKEQISLSKNYISIHIRGGDKYKEYELKGVEIYSELLKKKVINSDVFISTDDYDLFKRFAAFNPHINCITLSKETDCGYDFFSYTQMDKLLQYEANLFLFASIAIMMNSSYCLGSYTTNMGMFLGAIMEQGRFIDIDGENWRIT